MGYIIGALANHPNEPGSAEVYNRSLADHPMNQGWLGLYNRNLADHPRVGWVQVILGNSRHKRTVIIYVYLYIDKFEVA